MTPTQPLIETQGLTRKYTLGRIEVTALKDVDLRVDHGEFVGVTGPSGSGKSTLMNLLGGLDTPSSGRIYVVGRSISDLDQDGLAQYRRFQVGLIFQSFNLSGAHTALDNVALPLVFAGVKKKERSARARHMLARVGLERRCAHRPSELSGGEQQRVAIARALINRPQILFADEPTGNLDSRTAREILDVLADLHRHEGLTVIMISHEEPLLHDYANRIISLRDGTIVHQEGCG